MTKAAEGEVSLRRPLPPLSDQLPSGLCAMDVQQLDTQAQPHDETSYETSVSLDKGAPALVPWLPQAPPAEVAAVNG